MNQGVQMPIEDETLTTSMRTPNSHSLLAFYGDVAGELGFRSINEPIDKKVRRVLFFLLVAAVLALLSATSGSQSLPFAGDSSDTTTSTTSSQIDLTYVRPTQRIMVRNYAFDAFGPYSVAGAAIIAGIHQASNAPPESKQGVEGYSKRFGSEYGIALVATTTRYGLSEAFKED